MEGTACRCEEALLAASVGLFARYRERAPDAPPLPHPTCDYPASRPCLLTVAGPAVAGLCPVSNCACPQLIPLAPASLARRPLTPG